MRKYFPLFCLLCTTLFFSCKNGEQKAETDFLSSNIDTTIKPGDDFFLYANNNWFKNNPIPPSEQSNGLWQLILDTVNAQIRQICESAAESKENKEGSNKQKIGDLYFSGMDSVSLNKSGISALKPELDRISQIKDINELTKAAAEIHMVSGAPFFGFYVGQDDKISSKYAIFLRQGGLSLPDRSYYFDTDSRAVEARSKFKEYAVQMFALMGMDSASAKKAAAEFYEIESALAQSSRKREDTRDPLKNYNKITNADLIKLTPNWNWASFMSATGLNNADSVIVCQPEFFTALNGYLKKFTIEQWKNYLKFHLVNGLAAYMDDRTYQTYFNFYSATLRGIKEPKPRWKRVVEQTNRSLGELIGQIYVEEYLPKGTKEKLLEIGNSIREVYAERIKSLDWMSAPTKQKALSKLNSIIMKVGYPDKWKDMGALKTNRTSYVRNIMSANSWAMTYEINKYGKPVDRKEWDMYPQTYNAYYNPSNNEIVVPGCNIIVPGYERKMADDAILYSIIGGSTFGHEITHGFDDQGSKYDEYGNLNNWWTPEDSAKFYQKTGRIVEQFNNYIAVDSLHINGELTQGENIADLGGIMMGYEAFKKTSQYKNKETIAGLSPDQRFFLGYALAWMINDRPEGIANQVKSDEHSPAKFRVLGPLSNMPEFFATFNIKKGDKMFREDSLRVKIW